MTARCVSHVSGPTFTPFDAEGEWCRKTQAQGRCGGKNTGLQKPLVSHIYCIICVFFYLSYLHVCIKYPKLCEVFLVCLHRRIDLYLLHLWSCIYFHFACESGSNVILYFTVWMYYGHFTRIPCSSLHLHVYYLHTEIANSSLFMP